MRASGADEHDLAEPEPDLVDKLLGCLIDWSYGES